MSCPTCDHTMNSVSEDNLLYWCPRCGTLTDRNGRSATPPKLVERCREFESWCRAGANWRDTNHYRQWHSLGIAESINVARVGAD